ncbi:SET domain-containing protein [Frateuria aurantia]
MTRRISARRSPIHGHGVFALADLAKGETVIEYRGELISHAEADQRYGDDGESGHTFLFTLNDDYVVDGNRKGNVGRWINHSCAPNCQAHIEMSADGDPRHDRILIEAIRDIRRGEELTYDYGIVLAVPHTARLKQRWPCHCGAAGCSGTLLKSRRRRIA